MSSNGNTSVRTGPFHCKAKQARFRRRRSQTEFFTQINTFYLFISKNVGWRAVGDQFALTNDVGAFTHVERFTNVVVGNQHAEAAVTQVLNDFFDVDNGNRVNTGEGFIQQDKRSEERRVGK